MDKGVHSPQAGSRHLVTILSGNGFGGESPAVGRNLFRPLVIDRQDLVCVPAVIVGQFERPRIHYLGRHRMVQRGGFPHLRR